MNRTVRVIIFLIAILAIFALLGGGGYLAWKQITSAPKIDVGTVPAPGGESGGIEKQLTGFYLQFRQGDLETPVNPNGAAVSFVVEPGQSAGEIAASLQEAGLISDASLFRTLVKYYGLANRLEAGEYQLSPAMTMMEVAETLQHGRLQEKTITIPEGWRIEQIAELLEEQGIATKEEFMGLATADWAEFGFLSDRPAGASLEGYLFPDTYQIGPEYGAREVIALMLQTFDRRVSPELRAQAEAQGMTLREVITLAGIVEREAVIPDERPVIAKVYLNRLDIIMHLGADPTVQYAKGFDPATGKWWNTLTAEDYQAVDSDYNTYTHYGLPPGPICAAGLDSIRAVLYPADVVYLYFLRNDVKGDGSHVFATTFDEHLANQAKYRR